jgi:glycosyltransferase involved in cell wall biosynthesis
MSAQRVVIVTHEYYPVLSGGTLFIQKLAQEFAALGQDVEVWTTHVGWGHPYADPRDGVPVRRFWTGRRSRQTARLWEHAAFLALGIPQMLVAARRRKPDVLLAVFAVPAGVAAVVLSRVLRVPGYVYVDAADLPGIDSAMKGLTRHIAFVIRWVGRKAQGLFIGEGLEDLAARYLSNPNSTVLPHGSDLPTQIAAPGTHGEPMRFLSIGRLVPRKGFLDIVEACSQVRRARGDFRMTIVGSGPQEAEVRKSIRRHEIEDTVVMAGQVEYSRLPEWYLAADCYVFYGGREGASLALIEAVGYGLPVIASDEPGTRTYVQEGANGILLEAGHPDRLAAAMLRLLERPELLAAWGRRSREIAGQRTWRKVAEGYLECFEKWGRAQ